MATESNVPVMVLGSYPREVLDMFKHIGHQLRTQDEQCTANAMFVVESRRILTGFDTDYSSSSDDIVWSIEDEQFFKGDSRFEELELAYERDGTIPQDFSRFGYIALWDFVTVFFTAEAAEAFVEKNYHKYSGPLRVSVECEQRNHQWTALREGFMAMARAPVPAVNNRMAQMELFLNQLTQNKGVMTALTANQQSQLASFIKTA